MFPTFLSEEQLFSCAIHGNMFRAKNDVIANSLHSSFPTWLLRWVKSTQQKFIPFCLVPSCSQLLNLCALASTAYIKWIYCSITYGGTVCKLHDECSTTHHHITMMVHCSNRIVGIYCTTCTLFHFQITLLASNCLLTSHAS